MTLNWDKALLAYLDKVSPERVDTPQESAAKLVLNEVFRDKGADYSFIRMDHEVRCNVKFTLERFNCTVEIRFQKALLHDQAHISNVHKLSEMLCSQPVLQQIEPHQTDVNLGFISIR